MTPTNPSEPRSGHSPSFPAAEVEKIGAFAKAIEREAFNIHSPNSHTPVIVENVIGILRECTSIKNGALAHHAQILELEAKVSDLRHILITVLPMARGYAAEHPVGNNQQFVAEASAVLHASDSVEALFVPWAKLRPFVVIPRDQLKDGIYSMSDSSNCLAVCTSLLEANWIVCALNGTGHVGLIEYARREASSKSDA